MTLDSGDYFECLGLPRRLDLNRAELERRFYERSRQLHPDRFFGRPEPEKRKAEQAAARLNDARRTLRDPIARAEYLLGLYGLDKGDRNAPPELVEEVFEAKAALEQRRTTPAEARCIFEQKLAEADRQLAAAFGEWDRAGSHEALAGIRTLLDRRSYITSLLGELEAR